MQRMMMMMMIDAWNRHVSKDGRENTMGIMLLTQQGRQTAVFRDSTA